jgi:hypothetical protein
MRRWSWLVLAVVTLAGLGWRVGTPYVNAGPTLCAQGDAGCSSPIACGYLGLQGRIMLEGADSCPFVKLLQWDHARNLFNQTAAPSSRPPLPPGEAYCNGPAGPVNPGDKPDQPDCVDP